MSGSSLYTGAIYLGRVDTSGSDRAVSKSLNKEFVNLLFNPLTMKINIISYRLDLLLGLDFGSNTTKISSDEWNGIVDLIYSFCG